MRWLAILLIGLVFGAMLLFDTAALLRLGWLCLGGGCGVRPLSIAAGGGVIVALVAAIAWWQTRAPRKPARAPTKPASRPPMRKAARAAVRPGARRGRTRARRRH